MPPPAPGEKPLWALMLDDLWLPTRPERCLKEIGGYTKAWHVAVICDSCLMRFRGFGQRSLWETRTALARYGFPAPEACPGPRWGFPSERLSRCAQALAECRAMLEVER